METICGLFRVTQITEVPRSLYDFSSAGLESAQSQTSPSWAMMPACKSEEPCDLAVDSAQKVVIKWLQSYIIVLLPALLSILFPLPRWFVPVPFPCRAMCDGLWHQLSSCFGPMTLKSETQWLDQGQALVQPLSEQPSMFQCLLPIPWAWHWRESVW